MSSDLNLQSFIAQQRCGTEDSSGVFTLAGERQLELLPSFALEKPYDWLLKLLQAVSAWKAPLLQIKQSRIQSSFSFEVEQDEGPSQEDLVRALQEGDFSVHDPMGMFCLSLLSLVEQAGLSFVLSVDANADSAIFAGSDVERMTPQERRRWAKVGGRGVRLTVSHLQGDEAVLGRNLGALMRGRHVRIAEILRRETSFYSCPVELDSRRFCIGEHFKYGLGNSRPVIFSGIDCPRQLKPVSLGIPWGERFVAPERADLLKPRPGSQEIPLLVCAPLIDDHLSREHEVLWLRHGLVVERWTAPLNTLYSRMTMLLNAEAQKPDLSGLRLVRDHQRHRLMKPALAAAGQHLSELASRLGEELERDRRLWEQERASRPKGWYEWAQTLFPQLRLPESQELKQERHIWKEAVRCDLQSLAELDKLEFSIEEVADRSVSSEASS